MGSGLILIAIVGVWLVILIPMVLRSGESSTSLNTVDKFQDAMRVLSRRQSPDLPQEGEPVGDGAPAEAAPVATRAVRSRPQSTRGTQGRPTASRPTPARAAPAAGAGLAAVRPSMLAPAHLSTPARRLLLLALLALVGLTLVAALFGPMWLLAPHVIADLMLVGYLAHLRVTVRRVERERLAARQQAAAQKLLAARTPKRAPARPAAPAARPDRGRTPSRASLRRVRPLRIAGVPDRMPSRHTVLGTSVPLPATAEEASAVAPARGAQGGQWLPVPVPPPIYLSAPPPKRRPPARPAAQRSDGGAEAEPELRESGRRRTASG